LDEVVGAGVRRVTFSGGEPTLHPDLLGMLRHARGVGLQTSIITNAVRLTDNMLAELDVVGITLDAVNEAVLVQLGRKRDGAASYVDHAMAVAARTHRAGAQLKVNTVVTAINTSEDLTSVLVHMRPFKWKPLQFTHVPGENDAEADTLCVGENQFQAFVQRHRNALEAAGIWVASEPDDVVRSSYVMIDPGGRMFRSDSPGYATSDPVLQVGLETALKQVGGYDRAAFLQRGGHIDVRRLVRKERTQ